MLPDYTDIKAATNGAEPIWYDGNGVPRYAPFSPDMLGIYDDVQLYVRIGCQDCGQEFFVGESLTHIDVAQRAFPIYERHRDNPEAADADPEMIAHRERFCVQRPDQLNPERLSW